MHIERVKWRDATGDDEDGWKDAGELQDTDTIIESVGHVARETEAYLTLAMDMHPDGQTHTRGRIPKALIISRETLKGTS